MLLNVSLFLSANLSHVDLIIGAARRTLRYRIPFPPQHLDAAQFLPHLRKDVWIEFRDCEWSFSSAAASLLLGFNKALNFIPFFLFISAKKGWLLEFFSR